MSRRRPCGGVLRVDTLRGVPGDDATKPDPTPAWGEHLGSLSVAVETRGDLAVVVVAGEVDLESCAQLGTVLAGLRASHAVDVDLSAVTYLDSTGLRTLLDARDGAMAVGGRLRVSATSNIVARLLEITGTTDLLSG
jgi:anti-anti-sigma factor